MVCTDLKLVTNELIGQKITVNGWVHNFRKINKLFFIDLRNEESILQIFCFHPSEQLKISFFDKLTFESVISVSGTVQKRKSPNDNLENGDIELVFESGEILNLAHELSFLPKDVHSSSENQRLQYRYLDLRSFFLQNNLRKRNKFIHEMRNFLIEENFLEIDTPILAKPTPEGAKDFLVKIDNEKNKFYALPQSPQLFKQILMTSGFSKYFQIAKCFRDEDLRSDRQPEFTQLDLEMSFVDFVRIKELIEKMLRKITKNTFNKEIKTPFMEMNYQEAIQKYGSDKPDIRFDYFLQNWNSYKKTFLEKEKFADDISIVALEIPFQLEKKGEEIIFDITKKYALKNIYFQNHQHRNNINLINSEKKYVYIVDQDENLMRECLGLIRFELGKLYNLAADSEDKYLWIVNWPMFSYDKELKKYEVMHHPFTQPENLEEKDFLKIKAKAYDLVLNGVEIGGGSIRIHKIDQQKKVFDIIGLKPENYLKDFAFFLQAMQSGMPPHGGIALGIDRILMMHLKCESIRDVIAFPKNSKGKDLMLDTPTTINHE